MNKFVKRLFYYWRMPILFLILFFLLLWIGYSMEGDAGGVIGAIWLFAVVPGLIFFTIRAIYRRIRSIVSYVKTGIRDEEFIFPEIDFLRSITDAVIYEYHSVKVLPPQMILRYFLLRILSIVIIAGGIIGCFFFYGQFVILIIFTLVIIAGAVFWLIANPQTYNSRIQGTSMVPCNDEMTMDHLYECLLTIPTSLGTPGYGTVRGFKKPIIVYGSKEDDYIYVVYRARFSDFFYVSTLSSFTLIEKESGNDTSNGKSVQEYAFYLGEISDTVEKAVGNVRA